MRNFLGEPFFVTKKWFPQPPSKKVVLDISGIYESN